METAVYQSARALRSDRLRAALTARRLAVVGASDKSRWSHVTQATAERYGFGVERLLVNRRGEDVHGTKAYTSCRAIGEPIDIALLLVKNEALPDALRDAAAAGASSAVVLASGFGEAGPAGREAQRALVELADELELLLFGPNCLGFVNFVDRTAAWAAPAPVPDAEPGSIALISQSGAIAIQLGRFAAKQAIGFSHVVSTGNEAMVGAIDVAATLVEDERVACLAIFLESIRDAEQFDDFASRAAELDKPVVMLKAGRSALAAEVIASHTGALAGDDRVIDAALRQAGVTRVASLEELIVTAGLLTSIGRVGPGKLGVVSISGGACDMVADAAATLGTPLATFSGETVRRLGGAELHAQTRNPFDVTGAAVGGAELMGEAVSAVASDPDVAVVAIVDVLPDGVTVPEPSARLGVLAQAMAEAAKPCLLVHQVTQDVPGDARAALRAMGAEPWICGIDTALKAVGHLLRRSSSRPVRLQAPLSPLAIEPKPLSEAEALKLLEDNGVPVVPTRTAADAEDAVAAARELGFPVAVKVASADIVHKSDLGGVVLDVADETAVRVAFDSVTAAARATGAHVEGVLVAPMRRGGVELIAGVVRDPEWGLMLAVGLGGVWVNVLDDSSLRRLPVVAEDVVAMLGELRGRALLDGFRGAPAADVERVAEVVADLASLAARLGPRLESIEVNPLRVEGDSIEALDAAVIWS